MSVLTETPRTTLLNGTPIPNGDVRFGTSNTIYIAPYSRTLKYDDILPNVGATFRFGDGHSVYGNYAENLYAVRRLADGSIGNPTVQPESTQTLDLGYRYSAPTLVASLSAFMTTYDNRIVNTFDDDLGTSSTGTWARSSCAASKVRWAGRRSNS